MELDYGNGEPWVFLFYSANIAKGAPKPQEDGKTLSIDYYPMEEMWHYKKII